MPRVKFETKNRWGCSYLSLVGVRVFSINALVVFYVLKGLIHKTAVTAFVSVFSTAVNQVLLTQRDELAGFAEILTFQGASLIKGKCYF